MPGLLDAIACLKAVFDKYAKGDGDGSSLSKKEVATLLKVELPQLQEVLEGSGPKKEEACEFFKLLDEDGDGVVDFKEYIIFVATLALLCGME